MILCDTNILIEFYKKSSQVVEALHRIGRENLAISVISEAELDFGAIDKAELQKISRHLKSIHRIPLDAEISSTFVQLMETYVLSHKLSIPDGLIAATALVHKASLYTLNVRDFQFIPQISLYSPAKTA